MKLARNILSIALAVAWAIASAGCAAGVASTKADASIAAAKNGNYNTAYNDGQTWTLTANHPISISSFSTEGFDATNPDSYSGVVANGGAVGWTSGFQNDFDEMEIEFAGIASEGAPNPLKRVVIKGYKGDLAGVRSVEAGRAEALIPVDTDRQQSVRQISEDTRSVVETLTDRAAAALGDVTGLLGGSGDAPTPDGGGSNE